MDRLGKVCVFFIFLFQVSCIDEIRINVPEQDRKIAVDGWVSNDPNMTYVKVYYPAAFQSGSFNRYTDRPEIRRMYVETETAGRNIDFEFSFALDSLVGSYLPVGDFELDESERYRLNFILQDRTHYQSTWQEVAPGPEIKDYHYQGEERLIFINPVFGEAFGQNQIFLNVNVDLIRKSEDTYGYYIKTSGMEEVHTQFDPENPPYPECQCTCYLFFNYLEAKINIDQYQTNIALGESGRFNVVGLPMNRLGRFFVEIDIYALNMFQTSFLNLIKDQQENTGNIFDAMPSNLKGNIVNLSDESENVLGTFSTANHKYDYRMVRRLNYYASNQDLEYKVEGLPISNYCVSYYTEGSMEVPEPFRQIIYDH